MLIRPYIGVNGRLLAVHARLCAHGSVPAEPGHDVHQVMANVTYRNVVRDDGWKLILPYEPNRGVALTIDGGTADWMRTTADPRAPRDDDRWDRYPYYGGPAAAERGRGVTAVTTT